jgi:hypothetical protein
VNDENAIALRLKKECSVVVLKSEQMLEDGQVRLKYVAVDCDFNVILN